MCKHIGTPTSLRCINLEFMQRRIGSLEEENRQLRCEASQLAHDTEDCEMAEQRLVQDIASQLGKQIFRFLFEAGRKLSVV
jgi:trafficking kinesin-binding protein 1